MAGKTFLYKRDLFPRVALKEMWHIFTKLNGHCKKLSIESQSGTPEGDRMDVLVTLVEAYEAKNFPIPEPDDPVQVLEYYMESRGLSRTDLIPYLGSKESVSEVLNRKRGLSPDDSTTACRPRYPCGSFGWKARLQSDLYRQAADRVACTGISLGLQDLAPPNRVKRQAIRGPHTKYRGSSFIAHYHT